MIECCGMTDPGCVRANNEDYFLEAPELGLCVLADGMGGANAGERASQLAVQTVWEVVKAAGAPSRDALLEAMEQANRAVLSVAKSDRRLEGMGTTLVAALDAGDEILITSVGDSRAYLLEQDALVAVTQDQSWVNEVGRVMGLDEQALRTHPLRHVLTMAIGAGNKLVVNSYACPWQVGSLLLLSSDGLHGVVEPSRIEEILREPDEPEEPLRAKCRKLIEAARSAGAPDNVTAVLIRRRS